MKKTVSILLCMTLILSLSCPALAAGTMTELQTAVSCLQRAGVMTGDANGEMHLEDPLNRAELAIILSRMVVNQEHLNAEKDYYTRKCTFRDVPEWAQAHVGYCLANHLVTGYGNGLYGAADPVTPAAACTVMLRCLADAGKGWDYDSAVEQAVKLELAPAELLGGTEITRAGVAVLAYHTMLRMGWDLEPAADAGDTRYVPKAGDVILCDDGTEYTITDVSRWDKNAFAEGPLAELPAYDPDWDLLPQPEMPEAEARRFQSDGTDYLFVRNLYETKRMLYTLYQAIVDNPETWQDGKPVAFSNGNPKVRISLTIPDGVDAQFFWPWRESQITDLFNSCPPGHYRMESWDVYRNGVYQRTEYDIYID